MHNISKECVFIFFVRTIHMIMWNGIWMVKILGCDQGSKGFKPHFGHVLCMILSWQLPISSSLNPNKKNIFSTLESMGLTT